MLRRSILAWLPFLLAGQEPTIPPPILDKAPEPRLPNGKLQRDEILKSEYEKSLQDAAELAKLAQDLRLDLEKSSAFVVSLQTIRKTDEIEKLARRIRGRLKRS